MPIDRFELKPVDSSDLDRFRSVYLELGAPYGWSSRPSWSDRQWADRLDDPSVTPWLVAIDGHVAGVVELELHPEAVVELCAFGLLDDFVGRGFGGHLLTVAARRAWALSHADGAPTRRVWLHTSSYDHPHALANYEARGFRVVRRERRRHEVDPDVEMRARHRPGRNASGGSPSAS